MISKVQKPFFDHYYQTQEDRIQFLPPGISRDRVVPDDVAQRRLVKRANLGLHDDQKMLLMVGSGFVKKGLGRAIFAVWRLPRSERRKVRFFVIFRCLIFRLRNHEFWNPSSTSANPKPVKMSSPTYSFDSL